MGFLLDCVDDKKLENQRDVVRNERRQSIESAPYGLVQEELFHLLFPPDHPYYASVIGSHQDIEAARLSDVREFFQLYYAPNNASLAIVGDIDPAATERLVEKYFGPIPAGKPVPRPRVITPPITSQRRITVEDQVELPRIYIAWITPPIFSQGDADCDLAARILGGGKSSRLYRKLVYDRRIAQDTVAHQYSLALGSVFTIEATCKPGVEPRQVEDAIWEELAEFSRTGPTEAELERAGNTIESHIIRALENLGGFGGVADRLNQYNHFLGDPGYLPRDIGRYRSATLESLRRLAETELRQEKSAVVYGVPGTKVITDVPRISHPASVVSDPQPIPGQEWRSNPPAPEPSPALSLPIPNRLTLSNGLSVFLVEQHSLPIVSANLIVLSGSDRNPPDLPGLASFTAEMLTKGRAGVLRSKLRQTPIRSAHHCLPGRQWTCRTPLCAPQEEHGCGVRASVGRSSQPLFAPEEIERIRHHRVTHIQQQKDNPAVLAIKVFFNAVYGPSHPYGFTDIGTEESNRVLTRDLLRGFYQGGYTAANSALIVAGDLTQPELESLAEKHLGGWRSEGEAREISEVGTRPGRRIIVVHKPASPQTVLRIGHVGTPRSNPDYVALEVMNTALGGLFSSRINQNLREKHGYTYGASSAFIFRRGAGPFLVGTSVRTDVTADAIREIFREIERMRESEILPEELATAKDSISRSLRSV